MPSNPPYDDDWSGESVNLETGKARFPKTLYDCHKHGVQVGDHCPLCVVHAYIPAGLGPLPEDRRSAETQELDAQMQRQALKCHRLRQTLDVLEQYPRDGATSTRILKLSLLEFSRQLQVMQRVCEKILALTALPVPLATLIERAEKEVEG